MEESEQQEQSNQPQRLMVKPSDYAKLYNWWNPCLKKVEDDNSQQKRRFAFRKCKVNLGSDTPQNYQQAVLSLEKNPVDRGNARRILLSPG